MHQKSSNLDSGSTPLLLIIAKDYPPSSESSGVQRILKFSQYLPASGWAVKVLTMRPFAYGKAVSLDQVKDIPESVEIGRACALNTALHLSIHGRYFSFMALPDRWASWVPFGVIKGLTMIFKQRPTALFSTYPCASAHLIGLILHRLTGIPWIADFRDPMLYKNDNVQSLQKLFYKWIESRTIKHCNHAIFTTPSAIERYAKLNYPQYPDDKWVLIANGYDEQNFLESASLPPFVNNNQQKPLTLVHAGYLYQAERDPSFFFKAVARLIEQKAIAVDEVRIVLRASGHETLYGNLIKSHGLQDVIFLEPAIPYKQALSEMLNADGLLLFQGDLCNHQIPAKVYEYFRAKKPIFALADEQGDTAQLLRDAGINSIAPLNDEEKICLQFLAFIQQLKINTAPIASDDFVSRQSRQSRSQELVKLLNKIPARS